MIITWNSWFRTRTTVAKYWNRRSKNQMRGSRLSKQEQLSTKWYPNTAKTIIWRPKIHTSWVLRGSWETRNARISTRRRRSKISSSHVHLKHSNKKSMSMMSQCRTQPVDSSSLMWKLTKSVQFRVGSFRCCTTNPKHVLRPSLFRICSHPHPWRMLRSSSDGPRPR